jgi:hypothetical protein
MAKLVFGMNQSLDRYVDHTAFAPSPTLFRHFIEEARHQTGKWEAAEQPSRRRGASSRSGSVRRTYVPA